MSPRKLSIAMAVGAAVVLAGCSSAPGPASQSLAGGASQVAATNDLAVAGSTGTDPVGTGEYTAEEDTTEEDAEEATEGESTTEEAEETTEAESGSTAERSTVAKAPATKHTEPAKPATQVIVRFATQLTGTTVPNMGSVVTDQSGWILYRFDKDRPSPSTSACTGECAKTWPPVLVTKAPTLLGVDAKLVGTLRRPDGKLQVTLHGWPLYYYSKDLKPGDWKGQGKGGTWFVSAKDGERNLSCLPKELTRQRYTTALVVQVVVTIGTVVTDQQGRILYRYDRDRRGSNTSNCNDACAANWPPVIVNGPLSLKGLPANAAGVLRRSDGSLQATLNGWPLYYYGQDTRAGDWKGQGKDGTWFAISKDGSRNLSGLPAGLALPAADESMD